MLFYVLCVALPCPALLYSVLWLGFCSFEILQLAHSQLPLSLTRAKLARRAWDMKLQGAHHHLVLQPSSRWVQWRSEWERGSFTAYARGWLGQTQRQGLVILPVLRSLLFPGFPVQLTYEEWNKKIQDSFEKNFWINEQPDSANEGEDARLIHRRGIYKDSYGASHKFADYQLRPNCCIAMTVVRKSFFIN